MVGRRDTAPFIGQERKSRQEVGPELMVAELSFKPGCPDSQPGALLSTSMNTLGSHSGFCLVTEGIKTSSSGSLSLE